jgi:branched-chain amino acid transport system substrate-binding protein
MKVPPIALISFGCISIWGIWSYLNSTASNKIFSIGEHQLISKVSTPDKKEGIIAFAKGNYPLAIDRFNSSLQTEPNDPETRIYLNNALVLKDDRDPVNLPIVGVISSADKGMETAQEVLRGVSDAQSQIDREGKINKRFLIKLAIDNNDERIGREIATKLVQDKQIKAVIGHLDSNVSVAVSSIYQRDGLVMVSPTSSSMELKGSGDYILRTVPNSVMMVNVLADYITERAKKRKLGFCFDSSLKSGNSFKDALIAAINQKGGTILPINCDTSDPQLDTAKTIDKLAQNGADGLVLYFHLSTDLAIARSNEIAKQARALKIPLFSSHALFTPHLLRFGQYYHDTILVSPRHPDMPAAKSFSDRSTSLWKTIPTWRTMSSFDALVAIAQGLEQSDNSRAGIKTVLHDPNFKVNGSSGPVKFSIAGDRIVTPTIIRVEPDGDKWKFGLVKLPELKTESSPNK